MDTRLWSMAGSDKSPKSAESASREFTTSLETGLNTAEVEALRQRHGFNEVKAKETPAWKDIMWRYLDWVSLVIIAAAIIAISVPNNGDRGYTSFVLLIIELNLIVWVGWYTDRNAGSAIKELEALAAPTAMVKRNGSWASTPVRELVPGDLIALKGGDVIPADCQLVGPGEPLKVDESSLTGESLAVTRRPGDKVLAGAVVAQGELEALVSGIGINTFFGKTMALLGTPQERGHLQKVLGRVSAGLGILAAFGCITIFIRMITAGRGAEESLVTFFVVLVSTVPIGMPVVTAAVLAVGAREMAREKAIVSRLSALEELSGMEVLCSDKTGTLTLNRLALDKEDIQAWGSFSQDDVLLLASLSARWTNQDAIDRAVTAAVGGDPAAISRYTISRLVPFNPVDKKTLAEVTTPDGRQLATCKGAPQIIRDMLDDEQAKQACDSYIAERASRGLRSLGVAQSTDGGASWQLVGLISLLDPPRPDSAETIRIANEMGVEVKMVTGDQYAIAVETAKRLGMGHGIMEGSDLMTTDDITPEMIAKVQEVDGFAGVYPEHKFKIVQALQARGTLVGMTGDGVNDAPALKRANVGIAVADATPAARGAADIVLLEEGIGTIITAIVRSRKIFRRLETYIVYRLASSINILGFFFFAYVIFGSRFDFPTWALVLISLTNDLSVMATSFDKVYSSPMPETWNMTKSLLVALSIGLFGVGAEILLLWLAAPHLGNWWHIFGFELEPEPDASVTVNPQTIAVMYFALTAFIQLSIFLTRNPSFWWHFRSNGSPRPGMALIVPVVAFVVGAFFIGAEWPRSVQPDGGAAILQGAGYKAIGITLAYAVIWLMLADVPKVMVQRMFRRYEVIKEHCHKEGVPPPGWVRALDAPANMLERLSDQLEGALVDYYKSCLSGGAGKQKLPAANGKQDSVAIDVRDGTELA